MARVIINGRLVDTSNGYTLHETAGNERGRSRCRRSTKRVKRRARAKRRQSSPSLSVSPTPKRRHGASHKGHTLNKWNEENMSGALNEWKDKNQSSTRSLREIARAWNIPYATFRRRIVSDAQILRTQHWSGRPTILSAIQEEELAVHIRNLAAAGFPCDRTDVKNLAYEYAAKNGIAGFSKKGHCRLLLVSWIYTEAQGVGNEES